MKQGEVRRNVEGAVEAARYSAKLIIKNITPWFGRAMLWMRRVKVEKEGYDRRILVIFGGGIGDVVKRSVVCEYVREHLSGYAVSYLMPYKISLPYAEQIIHFDYRKAKTNPLYFFRLASDLRRIGFSNIIVLLPAWEGFLVSLGAAAAPDVLYRHIEVSPRETIGIAAALVKVFQARSKKFRDIPVISRYDERWRQDYFPSDVHKVAYFFSKAVSDITGVRAERPCSLKTEIAIDASVEREFLLGLKKKYPDLRLERCCLIGLGSSSPTKNLPVEKFVEVAKALREAGLDIALIDHAKAAPSIELFRAGYGERFFNLGVDADLTRLFILIRHGAMVVSNDTSFVHLAIALTKPSVCASRGEQVGADSCYGYPGLNEWMFGSPVSRIEVRDIVTAAKKIIPGEYSEAALRPEQFVTSFFEQSQPL